MQVFKKVALLFLLILNVACSSFYNKSDISIKGGVSDEQSSVVQFHGEKAFKVAMLLPLTGKSSVYGIGLKNAAMMAIEDANNKNLVLYFYDTKSSVKGAIEAVREAIEDNVNLILGPLMSEEVSVISSKAIDKHIPVISFSTSPSVLKKGVYTLGLLGDEQVNRVISYAASKQRKRIVVIAPDTMSGLNTAKSAVRNAHKYGTEVVKLAFYPADTLDFAPLVKEITNYEERSAEITKRKKELEILATNGDEQAQKELKQIKNVYTTGEVDFDAVLIAETSSRLKSAAVMFGYYDIYYPDILFLGTSVWENTNLSKETTLYHGVYPVMSRVHNNYFTKKYERLFGQLPNQLYSFAYDGVLLASALSEKPQENIYANIIDSNGYVGINGAFRILENGTNEHSLDIVEVTSKGPKVVDKAPAKFENKLLDNSDQLQPVLNFPSVLGKDAEEVRAYILN